MTVGVITTIDPRIATSCLTRGLPALIVVCVRGLEGMHRPGIDRVIQPSVGEGATAAHSPASRTHSGATVISSAAFIKEIPFRSEPHCLYTKRTAICLANSACLPRPLKPSVVGR